MIFTMGVVEIIGIALTLHTFYWDTFDDFDVNSGLNYSNKFN